MVAGLDELRSALAAAQRLAAVLWAFALLACAPGEGSTTRPAGFRTADTPAVGADDLALRPKTHAEALAAFRVGLAVPTGLAGGTASREVLVASFIRAVAHSDTAAVRAMVLDRAEFAYLYYPSSPYAGPPMAQEAPLAWFLLLENSQKGVTRVFNRFAGAAIEYVGHRCDPEPDREGTNLLWRDCVVLVRTPADGVVTRRLFGSILVRDGHFKFFSYANDF